ncbi:MAG TPA: TIM barrel protein [Roseiflexaceae bacterium]|nr:TIM barrel protein [Roseiflexaceae bacterium]
MMLHFDLNVSILLKEYSFLERFDQAARLGFGAVEFWWPAGENMAAVARRIRDAGLRVALFNLDTGDMPAGDRGLLNDPDRLAQFRANLPIALELAQQVGCTQLNALGGKRRAGEALEVQLERVRENLRWAAEQARAAGVTILVEALNEWENGPYLFTNTRDTLALLDSLGEPNVKYQYDVYHMQRMEGNIAATIRTHIDRIAHIQIADSPGRNQPGTGELRFPFIFETIAASGYAGAIGLEYHPLGPSGTTFGWLPENRRGAVAPDAIRL